MNYRHAFHAGNFADLVKHAALTLVLARLTGEPGPLTVIDTHAGAGGYDLTGEMARRSGEAAQGVARLMAADDAPAAFDGLKAAVRAMGGADLYPGSPRLIAAAMRPGDRYIACELREDDKALLAQTLAPTKGAEARQADGYATAAAETPAKGRALVLIDPPFERGDDYRNIVETLRAVLARNPAATVAVWLPLKDLETFDALLRGVEGTGAKALVAEARLRPLIDPLKMNGCAMLLVGAPDNLIGPLEDVCRWVVERLGDRGGLAKVWRLG
ncbi:23S rRNA (adenine2030-N6)-methyltransferase [Caulobacter ginsengisoli]|uniref:Ribosomal RNA large subunit methyltransferase J n=1 Tax=Caulobacter ginsengisoli TaxID=400775 RepID=A0ABU0IKN6_9CAUL|nr:23S rRNA (adenine(2030)-N(6))-methyltransferase RlmJ [Caulobacter ginsengisoli]MDQ0462562.1 23S rRNA (adenine2030-N6)-methyltransferase [Caulobacter ginsengisoli]